MAPEGLSERGSALWSALTEDRNWDAAGAVLIAEACRIADRLEQLDRLLRREIDAWARIVDDYTGSKRTVELQIDDALAESRQQQGSLLQILTKLGLGKATSEPSGQEDPLDELVRQWAAGGSAAEGS